MIQFLIEASYWSAYYMKWKNEDHIPFFTGIYTVVVTLIINIMTSDYYTIAYKLDGH